MTAPLAGTALLTLISPNLREIVLENGAHRYFTGFNACSRFVLKRMILLALI